MYKKLFYILCLLTSVLVNAQKNDETNSTNLSINPIETIVFNTDRNLYLTSEKIWFNAHCYISNQTSSNNLSNVLYVELYNSSREFLIKRKFYISEGKAFGSIDIPSEFLSGNYYIRAYTQFLKNFPPEYYFTTLITIINPQFVLPKNTETISINSIDIVPDGGILLEGIESQVAFKISEKLNHQFKEICVADKENNIILNPAISEDGYGLFEVTPNLQSNLVIKFKLKNNDSIIKPFPNISKNGVLIKTQNIQNNKLLVDILNKNLPIKTLENNYQLIIYSRNAKILNETRLNLSNEKTQLIFSTNILNEGINYLILKDNDNNIIKIHAFYNNSGIKINVSPQKKNYLQRELVNLNLGSSILTDSDIKSISVSVVKKGTVQSLPRYTMENFQLLNSYLQDPNNISSLNNDQIDILLIYYNKMLSENSNLFRFEKSLTETQWLPEIRDISISGTVFDKANNLPVSNVPVYVSAFKSNPQIHMVRTKTNGEFVFSINNLVDQQDLFICPKIEDEKNLELKINNDFSYTFPTSPNIPILVKSLSDSLLKEMYINQQTNKLFDTKTTSNQLPVTHYKMNIGEPQIAVLIDDYIKTPTLEMVFRELIPNCLVHKKKDQYTLIVFDAAKSFYSENPLILLDNIPVLDVNELLKIAPSKLTKIEINTSLLVLGDNTIQGAIILTSNTNDFAGMKMPESSIFIDYQTISPSYSFQAPDYTVEEKRLDRSADFRTLLYWNPNLDITKNTSVSFYTSDDCSEYEVIVRGITRDGRYAYGKSSFSVLAK